MPALSAYANTENTALILLQKKGFQFWYDEKTDRYHCERDGWDFTAESATELLGVIAIFEHHQPKEYKEYWWRIREPWLMEELPNAPQDYVPVWHR